MKNQRGTMHKDSAGKFYGVSTSQDTFRNMSGKATKEQLIKPTPYLCIPDNIPLRGASEKQTEYNVKDLTRLTVKMGRKCYF